MKYTRTLIIFPLFFLWGCENPDTQLKKQNLRGEYIFRHHDEFRFRPPLPQPLSRDPYPWEEKYIAGLPCITKEYFRCKGNYLHPTRVWKRDGREPLYYRDCMGGGRHGLPLQENEEFVYPILLNLLNYLQKTLGKRVVITSGHRCPAHNAYCDYTPYNWGSKHMIGAEVDFYVEGFEERPEKIIALLQAYYRNEEEKAYATFERSKKKLNVSTPAWYNKEVFIKLYLPDEGRNADNEHTYPYIGIQVRYDRGLGKRVVFDKDQAQNYLRH